MSAPSILPRIRDETCRCKQKQHAVSLASLNDCSIPLEQPDGETDAMITAYHARYFAHELTWHRPSARNPRVYFADFAAVGTDGKLWLIETKGQADINRTLKDGAAELWRRNARKLGVGDWRYVKVRQKDFEGRQAGRLVAMGHGRLEA